MRSGRSARRAHLRNLLPPLDELAFSYEKFARVCVDRPEGAGVFHDHDLAIAAQSAAVDDTTRFSGKDRCPPSGRDVDALMRTATTHPKSRTQPTTNGPRKLQGCLLMRCLAGSRTHLVRLARTARCRPREILGTRPESSSGTRDIQALTDSQLRDIADAVGACNLFCGYTVATPDPVQIFSGFHVVNDAGSAGSRARTTDGTQR